MPGLSAGEGAGRGGAGLQCARWTREGSSTLRERRLVTNGIPSRGSSPAGGFQGCRLEAQKVLQERSGTLPAPGGTQSRPFLGPGLTPGLPGVYFVRLRLWVVVMGLCPRPW